MAFLESRGSKQDGYVHILDAISGFLLVAGTVVLPLFYLPFTQDVLNLPKVFLLHSIVLLALLLWLLRVTITKEFSLRRTSLDVLLAVFGVVVIVSALASLSQSTSFLGKTSDFLMNGSVLLSLGLWFWLFVQYVKDSARWRLMIDGLFLTTILTSILFIFRSWAIFGPVTNAVGFNTVSGVNSIFGIFIASVTTIALGFLMVKSRRMVHQILPAFAALLGFIVLLQIGFTVTWAMFVVGMGLLIILGTTMLAETHVSILSTVLILFLLSLFYIFLGTPDFVKTNLPVEVALGAKPSLNITIDTFFDSAKNFIFGSGPGTFVQDFSQFRPATFNLNALAWSIRFQQPYSVPFAFVAEFGILGSLSFLLIVLVALGSMFSAWLKTRPSVYSKKKSKSGEDDPIRLEVFVIVAAWITLTVGMAVSFFDLTTWWLWWTLLAAIVVGLSALIPSMVREKKHYLEVSPQYALVLSFGMISLFAIVILFGIFGSRLLLADVAFTKAINSANVEDVEKHLDRALELRSRYVPYQLAQAKLQLQKARIEALKPNSNQTVIADHLASAVNTAKASTDLQPKDVETWETLGTMYMNARTFASEANVWAMDAYKKAIELESTNPILHLRLADTQVFTQELEQAEESLRTAVQLKPDFVAAYVRLSQLKEATGEVDTAIALYGAQPIRTTVLNNAEHMFNLGRLFYNRAQEGDDANAEQVWLRAVQLEPNYANALYSLGLLYERNNETERAIEFFKRVQELNPDNEELDAKVKALLAPPPPPPPPPPPLLDEELAPQ